MARAHCRYSKYEVALHKGVDVILVTRGLKSQLVLYMAPHYMQGDTVFFSQNVLHNQHFIFAHVIFLQTVSEDHHLILTTRLSHLGWGFSRLPRRLRYPTLQAILLYRLILRGITATSSRDFPWYSSTTARSSISTRTASSNHTLNNHVVVSDLFT